MVVSYILSLILALALSFILPYPVFAMRLKFRLSRTIGKVRARRIEMQFSLMELPEELVALIVDHVTDLTTLRHLACTCSTLQRLAEPKIWRYLSIRTGSRAARLFEVLGPRCMFPGNGTVILQDLSRRTLAVTVLDIPCDPLRWRSFQDFAVVLKLIEACKNLTELMIESPACNTGQFEGEQEWSLMNMAIFNPFQYSTPSTSNNHRSFQNLQKRELNNALSSRQHSSLSHIFLTDTFAVN